MVKTRLPNSLRKFLRREKARLRREVLDPTEAGERIVEVVEKILREYNKKKGQKLSTNNESRTNEQIR